MNAIKRINDIIDGVRQRASVLDQDDKARKRARTARNMLLDIGARALLAIERLDRDEEDAPQDGNDAPEPASWGEARFSKDKNSAWHPVSEEVTRYRRCLVKPNGWGFKQRYAWIPLERAADGAVIVLQFPGEAEAEYAIVARDTLVIPGSLRPFTADVPVPVRCCERDHDGDGHCDRHPRVEVR